MSIINFLLQLHARNLRRKILEHRKANPVSGPDDVRKMNEQMIKASRARVNAMYPQQNAVFKPFDLEE